MKKILIFTAVLAAFAFSMSAQYTEIFNQPCFDSVQNLYTSSLDTANGINYEIADNFLDLADPIKKVEFYGACGTFSEGWVPGAPGATEPFFIRFYELVNDWSVPPEPLTAEITGTYTVNLYDTYGDGWNGGLLDVLVNGVVVLNDISCAAAGPDAFTFSAIAGDIISTVYTAGSWAYENWYEILDPNMAVIATDGDGTNQPTGLSVPVPLAAPETGTYTVNLYDTYGDGWNGGMLDVYVNGVVVLDNITLATGAGPLAFTFSANAGDEIATVLAVAGSWPAEMWYEILDPNLAIIATDGPGIVGIGFISQMVLYEPTWGAPDYEFNLACTSTYFMNAWDQWNVYKFEAILPEDVVLTNGWFSAQIDVDGGASNLFLFAPGTGLDMFSIQNIGTKGGLDNETLKKLMMVSSGNTRDDLANDMAFTLYSGEVQEDNYYRVIVEVWNGTDYLGVYDFTGPLNGSTPFASDPTTDYASYFGTYTMESPAPAGWQWQFTEYYDLDDISDFAQDPNDPYLWTAYVTFNLIEDIQTPVELSSFTATVTAVNDVELSWVSQTENNMNGYRVYRNTSADQNGSISITPILIPATNTSTTHTYSITDNSVEIGTTYYYWLEAVDYLSSGFHGPVSVTVTGNVPPVLPEITSMKSAYPNPFKANTTIEVSVKAGETGTMTIYNVAGKAVQTYNVTEGTHNLIWNGKDSAGNACGSGIYFYKLTTPSFNQSRKMIIVK